MLFVIYIRHKEISEFFRAKKLDLKYVPVVNLIATCLGVVACIGLDIVANFQINRVEYVHDVGVLVCYWCSSLYIFVQVFIILQVLCIFLLYTYYITFHSVKFQTVISFWMSPDMTSLWIVALRGILGIITTIFILGNLISEAYGEKKLKGELIYNEMYEFLS